MALACSELNINASFSSSTQEKPEARRSVSVVSLGLLNENGETDFLEIDEADGDKLELRETSAQDIKIKSQPTLNAELSYRRLSIADRVNRRRNSEFAFEISRLSAACREEELLRLLEEHSRLVHTVQMWTSLISIEDTDKSFSKRLTLEPKVKQKSSYADS